MSGTSQASAAGAFALNRPRPEIGDGRRAVGVLGIELGQFLLGFALDPLAPFADFIGEALAVFGDVFEDDLVEQHGTGLRSLAKASAPTRKASSGMEPPPANGSTTSGRVPGAPPSASCAAWVSARLVSRYSRTVELSQLAKSAMKSSSAPRSSTGSSNSVGLLSGPSRIACGSPRSRSCLPLVRQSTRAFAARAVVAERRRAQFVRRVGPQRRADHRPARRQRPPRPPDVQRRDVPVPDRLLAPRVRRDALDGQVDLDQALR